MSTRSKTLVAQFLTAHTAFVNLIDSLSAEDWLKVPAGEQRSVGAIAYHTAEGYLITFQLAQMIANRQPLPHFEVAAMHAANARQAADNAGVGKGEVLSILETNAAALAAGLYALTDEQLAEERDYFGRKATVAEGTAYLVLHHVQEHAASIRSVLQPEPLAA